jgi:hypothetical protein
MWRGLRQRAGTAELELVHCCYRAFVSIDTLYIASHDDILNPQTLLFSWKMFRAHLQISK